MLTACATHETADEAQVSRTPGGFSATMPTAVSSRGSPVLGVRPQVRVGNMFGEFAAVTVGHVEQRTMRTAGGDMLWGTETRTYGVKSKVQRSSGK